ncbi:MAG: six-cysteine ranthipeptide SCIFF [bacterium]
MKEFNGKNIKLVSSPIFAETAKESACGKCSVSCQTACKTSCTVSAHQCEKD